MKSIWASLRLNVITATWFFFVLTALILLEGLITGKLQISITGMAYGYLLLLAIAVALPRAFWLFFQLVKLAKRPKRLE